MHTTLIAVFLYVAVNNSLEKIWRALIESMIILKIALLNDVYLSWDYLP